MGTVIETASAIFHRNHQGAGVPLGRDGHRAVGIFRRSQIVQAATFNFTVYLIVAIIFLLLTIPMSRFVDWLVARDRRRHLAGAR
jgi:hypothetical protein